MEEVLSTKEENTEISYISSVKNVDEKEEISFLACRLSSLTNKREVIVYVEGKCFHVENGNICGKNVSKTPDFCEGINFCNSHQPNTGTPFSKCPFVSVKDGLKIVCGKDIYIENEEFCKTCVDKIIKKEEKERKSIEIHEDKQICMRILTRGSRRGKCCQQTCVIGENFCKDCLKSNYCKNILNDDKNDNINQVHDKFEIPRMKSIPVTLIKPFFPDEMDDIKSIPEIDEFPLPSHIIYIVKLFTSKIEDYKFELAFVLQWYMNGHFKYYDFDKSCYWYLNESKKWIRLPLTNKIPIKYVKISLIKDIIRILNCLSPMSEDSKLFLESIKGKILEHRFYEIDKKTFTRFLQFIKNSYNDPNNCNLIKFLEDYAIKMTENNVKDSFW